MVILDNFLDFKYKFEFLNVNIYNVVINYLSEVYGNKEFALWKEDLVIYTSNEKIKEYLKNNYKYSIIFKDKTKNDN